MAQIIGFAQWLVLRRHLSSAWWWIFASLLGWGVIGLSSFGFIGWFAPRTLGLFPRLVYGVIDGATLGLILGMAQWWVLRQYVSKAWGWIFANILYWSISLAVGWIVGGILRHFTHLFLSEVVGLGITWMLVAGLTRNDFNSIRGIPHPSTQREWCFDGSIPIWEKALH